MRGDLQAFETIRDRPMTRGAAHAFVTDFGPHLSLLSDPDGLEGEVLVDNPDAEPGVNPPGTPAPRYVSSE